LTGCLRAHMSSRFANIWLCLAMTDLLFENISEQYH
jgi:hypothetical protein